MNVFILEVIKSIDGTLFLETIGIYSSHEKALKAIEKLPPESDDMVYNVDEFILDDPAINISGDPTEKDLKQLMDIGVIDQLVGEDGRFYYELTDLGNKIAKNLTIQDLKDLRNDEEP